MIATEQIFIEALSLPSRARAELVHKLLNSLEGQTGSPDIEAAWKSEAIDRCQASDLGHIPERDASDVFRDAYPKMK